MTNVKKFVMVALIAGTALGGAVTVTATPAAAREEFMFSFDTGNVGITPGKRANGAPVIRTAITTDTTTAIATAAGAMKTATVSPTVMTVTAMVTACRTASTTVRTIRTVVS